MHETNALEPFEHLHNMSDSTIVKVDSAHAPIGQSGQKHLAMSRTMSMRLWDEEPGTEKESRAKEYETIGYVISGKAELRSEGQLVTLQGGDSWVVPKHASHSYKIIEQFKAVEVTHPPAELHGRSE